MAGDPWLPRYPERLWHSPEVFSNRNLRRFELGYSGTPLRRQLVEAVLRGDKTATASLRSEYAPHTSEPLPSAGERCVLLDDADTPCGVVETLDVSVERFADVDLRFAIDEGEGFSSVQEWRSAHIRFWSGRHIDDDTLIVCERFRLMH